MQRDIKNPNVDSGPHTNVVTTPQKAYMYSSMSDTKNQLELNAWIENSTDLANSAIKHFVNREFEAPIYSDHWHLSRPVLNSGLLVHKNVLINHFRGIQTAGAYTTDDNGLCKWAAIDIDAHRPDSNPVANEKYAFILFKRLEEIGITSIIEDSGSGGFHIWILFEKPVSAKSLYRFLTWLTEDSTTHNVGNEDIDLRPAQATLAATGKKIGNLLRLPGKHHKRDFWSRLSLGSRDWLTGREAVQVLLEPPLNAPDLIQVPEGWTAKAAEKRPEAPSGGLATSHDDRVLELAGSLDVLPLEKRLEAAWGALKGKPGAIQGNAADAYVFGIACQILWDFALCVEDAVELMARWGELDIHADSYGGPYPWTWAEMAHKCRDAAGSLEIGEEGKPLGWRVRGTLGPEDLDRFFIESRKAEIAVQKPETEKVEIKPSGDSPAELHRQMLEAEKAKTDSNKIQGCNLVELLKLANPTWQVKDHFSPKSNICLFGPSGAGKSFYALELAWCIATGEPFLGKFETKQGNVVYMAAEGFSDLKVRMQAILKQRGVTVPPSNIVFTPHCLNLCESNKDEFRKELAKLAEFFNRTLGGVPSTIFLDTLNYHFGSGDEDKTKDMTQYCQNVRLISEVFNCSVVSVHHTGKDATKGERGNKTLRNSVEVSIMIDEGNSPNLIEVSCIKQKNWGKFPTYLVKTTKIELGFNCDGDELSSLVLAYDRQFGEETNRPAVPDVIKRVIREVAKGNNTRDKLDTATKLGKKKVDAYTDEAESAGYLEKTGAGKKNNPWIYTVTQLGEVALTL